MMKELLEKNGYILYKEELWNDIYVLPDLLSKKIVNSFDIFDTIIHRTFMDEQSNIKILFSDTTKFIERKKHETNSISLKNIYDNMYDDQCLSDREYKKEIDIEIINMYVNYNNFEKIKINDILIFDTFHSYDENTFCQILT